LTSVKLRGRASLTTRLNAERGRRAKAAHAELVRIETEIRNIVSAVKPRSAQKNMQATRINKAGGEAATALALDTIFASVMIIRRRYYFRM